MTSPPAPPRQAPPLHEALSQGTAGDREEWRHQDLVTRLASAADEVAQDALAKCSRDEFRGRAGVDLASALARQLADSALLPKRGQAARLRSLLAWLKLSGADVQYLAESARAYAAQLRVTAAEFLPADVRPVIYGEPPRPRDEKGTEPTAAVSHMYGGADTEHEVSPVPAGVDSGDERDADVPAVVSQPGSYTTVLLLCHPDRQEGNRRLLESADAELDTIGVETLDGLRQSLRANIEICACVVDQSFLDVLEEGEQRALFEELAGFSTFIHVRVHDAGLKMSHEDVLQITKRSRGLGNDVPATALSFQADGAIRRAELGAFQHSATLLRSHARAQFVLGDLSVTEGRLLVAAVRARLEAERLEGGLEVQSLTTRFLSGGRSGARLATVRVNEEGRTLVAKITSKAYALDEIRRFRTFVQEWDPQLQPAAYFHGDDAVILFGLVASDDARSSPALPLEERIAELWNGQWLGMHTAAELSHRAEALGRGLERTARELAELNALTPRTTEFSCYVNPGEAHIAALEAEGFDCGLGEEAKVARTNAVARLERLKHAAVVHGDVHLRNMLIRGEGEIHLIDYAASGPGHPALDLVRLELALYVGPVRQFERDEICVDFQRKLSIELASLDDLRQRFPLFFQCNVNAACARGMLAARDRAIEAVRSHGGDPLDYLAAKYLVAWQHLGLIGSHAGLARAVILALGPRLAAM